MEISNNDLTFVWGSDGPYFIIEDADDCYYEIATPEGSQFIYPSKIYIPLFEKFIKRGWTKISIADGDYKGYNGYYKKVPLDDKMEEAA